MSPWCHQYCLLFNWFLLDEFLSIKRTFFFSICQSSLSIINWRLFYLLLFFLCCLFVCCWELLINNFGGLGFCRCCLKTMLDRTLVCSRLIREIVTFSALTDFRGIHWLLAIAWIVFTFVAKLMKLIWCMTTYIGKDSFFRPIFDVLSDPRSIWIYWMCYLSYSFMRDPNRLFRIFMDCLRLKAAICSYK